MKIYKVETSNFIIGYYGSLELAEKSRDEHLEKELGFYLSQFSHRKKSIQEQALPAFLTRNEIQLTNFEIVPKYNDIEDLRQVKQENTTIELVKIEEINVLE